MRPNIIVLILLHWKLLAHKLTKSLTLYKRVIDKVVCSFFSNRWHVVLLGNSTAEARIKTVQGDFDRHAWRTNDLFFHRPPGLQWLHGLLFFLRTEQLPLLNMGLWQKSIVFMIIFMCIYICHTEKKNKEWFQCSML